MTVNYKNLNKVFKYFDHFTLKTKKVISYSIFKKIHNLHKATLFDKRDALYYEKIRKLSLTING